MMATFCIEKFSSSKHIVKVTASVEHYFNMRRKIIFWKNLTPQNLKSVKWDIINTQRVAKGNIIKLRNDANARRKSFSPKNLLWFYSI